MLYEAIVIECSTVVGLKSSLKVLCLIALDFPTSAVMPAEMSQSVAV